MKRFITVRSLASTPSISYIPHHRLALRQVRRRGEREQYVSRSLNDCSSGVAVLTDQDARSVVAIQIAICEVCFFF